MKRITLNLVMILGLILSSSPMVCAESDLTSIIKRAKAGEVEAQAYLGAKAARENDLIGAEKWYRKAANQGDFRSQNALSVIYLVGIPGKRKSDLVESYAWLLIGAKESGDQNALQLKSALDAKLTPEQKDRANTRATEIRKRIAVNKKPVDKSKILKYVAQFNGKCTRAVFLGNDKLEECYGRVVNIVLKDGRSEFGYYMTGGTSLIFSGGKDSQPETNRYILEIDSVRMLSGKVSQGSLPASGKCIVSGEIIKAAILSCKANVGKKLLDFEVKADQPAKWKNY